MNVCMKFFLVAGVSFAGFVYGYEVDRLASGLKGVAGVIMQEEYIGDKDENNTRYWGGIKYTFVSGGPKNVALYIKRGDMMQQGAQAVVDAANIKLVSGGGVTGVLQAAVQEYVDDNNITYKNFIDDIWRKDKKNGLDGIGIAWLNTNKNVRVQYGKNVMQIIHAHGPQCSNGTITKQQKIELGQSYVTSLQEAEKGKVTSIAFPFISSDIYGCGFYESVQVIVDAVLSYLLKNQNVKLDALDIVLYQSDSTINETSLERQGWFVKAVRSWAESVGEIKKDPAVDVKIFNKK